MTYYKDEMAHSEEQVGWKSKKELFMEGVPFWTTKPEEKYVFVLCKLPEGFVGKILLFGRGVLAGYVVQFTELGFLYVAEVLGENRFSFIDYMNITFEQ